MTTADFVLLRDWGGFVLSQGILGPGTMILIKGTLPPPFSHKKASPILGTSLVVLGLTLMLVFGAPDLLQRSIEKFFPK